MSDRVQEAREAFANRVHGWTDRDTGDFRTMAHLTLDQALDALIAAVRAERVEVTEAMVRGMASDALADTNFQQGAEDAADEAVYLLVDAILAALEAR